MLLAVCALSIYALPGSVGVGVTVGSEVTAAVAGAPCDPAVRFCDVGVLAAIEVD